MPIQPLELVSEGRSDRTARSGRHGSEHIPVRKLISRGDCLNRNTAANKEPLSHLSVQHRARKDSDSPSPLSDEFRDRVGAISLADSGLDIFQDPISL